MTMTVPVFPDVELLLISVLTPLNPAVRFVTIIPAGDPVQVTARIHRISGANRNIGLDNPIVDIDVFGLKSDTDDVSLSARAIQSQILSIAGAHFARGTIQHASTIAGPRQLPEANTKFVRFNATYELRVHP